MQKLQRSNLFVGPNKPYKTIQAAIDAASDFAQIDIVPGIYQETLVIMKSGLKIQSEGGRGKKNQDEDVIIMPMTGPCIFIDIPPEERC